VNNAGPLIFAASERRRMRRNENMIADTEDVRGNTYARPSIADLAARVAREEAAERVNKASRAAKQASEVKKRQREKSVRDRMKQAITGGSSGPKRLTEISVLLDQVRTHIVQERRACEIIVRQFDAMAKYLRKVEMQASKAVETDRRLTKQQHARGRLSLARDLLRKLEGK
jgi:hypothetical protein